jgi:peptide-methionine (S)-S-oxide reductase
MLHSTHLRAAVRPALALALAVLAAGGCRPDEEGHAMTTPPRTNTEKTGPRQTGRTPAPTPGTKTDSSKKTALATFAAGCFWGVEAGFRQVAGVVDAEVGYTGGHTENPTYKEVCTGTTGHAEAVRVTYDPDKVTYDQLLDAFWNMHNPTTANRQGPDVGSQYRSAIFYHTPEQEAAARESKAALRASSRWGDRPIVTEIEPAGPFWRAEEYHQRYFEKHGRGACGT